MLQNKENTILFLIGFMGVGKSFWGPKLSKALNYSYLDSDNEIEFLEKKPIIEIFNTQGEGHFRELERKFINDFRNTNCVVSLGGGFPIYNNNMELLNQKGTTIYIEEPFDICFKRIKESKRPLVSSEKNLKELYEKRLPIYRKAQFVVKSPKLIEDFIKLLN